MSGMLQYCPKCNSAINIDLSVETVMVVCDSCRETSIKKTDTNLKPISFDPPGSNYKLPKITIGEKIILREEELTVTGYAIFKERGKPYSWSEFYLSNAQHVYSLAEFKGGYSLLKSLALPSYNISEVNASTLRYENRTYKLFNQYTIEVKEVCGQIPFDLSQTRAAMDYVCPPYILVVNKSPNKPAEYFEGDYISISELEAAFGKYFPPPEVTPMGKVLIRSFRPSDAWKWFAIFMVIVLTLFFVSPIASLPQEKLNQVFTLKKGQTSISESFELTGHMSSLKIETGSYLFNSWVGFDFTLVNEKTNEEVFFYSGLEYYAGIEDGESWSEGSETGDEIISSLPPGKYHLAITPDIPAGKEEAFLRLITTEDPKPWGNLIGIILMAIIWPVAFYLIEKQIDRNRWYNSDYSPYNYGE